MKNRVGLLALVVGGLALAGYYACKKNGHGAVLAVGGAVLGLMVAPGISRWVIKDKKA